MPTLILVPRDIPGFACAAVAARYVRYHLLEEASLSPEELRFSDPDRVGRHLSDAAAAPPRLTKIVLAGLGVPRELRRTAEALARLEYQGVEVDWYDHRPWEDAEARERIGASCRLVVAARSWPSAPQFLCDGLGMDDHRTRRIVEVAEPPERQSFREPEERRWGARWFGLLAALRLPAYHRHLRPALRQLAFDYHPLGPEAGALLAEEMERRRWMARDLGALLPFPLEQTRTRQQLAVVDLRPERGAPPLDPFEVGERVARRQGVRYTLLALTNGPSWVGQLYSWPSDLGDLAAVPGLAQAAGADFAPRFEAPNRASFAPRRPELSLRDLARGLSARL